MISFRELQEGEKVYCVKIGEDVDVLYVSYVMHSKRVLSFHNELGVYFPEESDWNSSVGFGIDSNHDKFLFYIPDKFESKSSEVCEFWGDNQLNTQTPLFSKSIIVTPSSINFKDDLFHIQVDGIVRRGEAIELFLLTDINGRGTHVIKTSVKNEDKENPWIYVKTVTRVNSNVEYHISALTPNCLNKGIARVLKEILIDNLDEIDRLNKFAVKIQNKIDDYEELKEWNYEDISKFD